MSISDTRQAQKFASIAEIAAAETKLLLAEVEKAPEYANEARLYAEAASSSATSAQQQAEIASSAASESVGAAQTAADNATTIINQQLADQQVQFQNLLSSYGLQFIGDYEDGPFTFTARNQYIRYDETYWQVSSATNLPFTTTGTNSASWANDLPKLTPVSDDDALRSSLSDSSGATLIGVNLYETLQDNLSSIGFTLASAQDIKSGEIDVEFINVRGFYNENDGGAGTWQRTGNKDPSIYSKHIASTASLYDAGGNEYALSIKSSRIDPLSNGAVPLSYQDAIKDVSQSDTVCFGEVVNGITSRLPYLFNANGQPSIYITTRPNIYRISKIGIKARNYATFDFSGCSIYIRPSNENKYPLTNRRINGFQHGVDEIMEKYAEAGNTGMDWAVVSLRYCRLIGAQFKGDQSIRQNKDNFTSGCGIIVLNPEYCNFENCQAQQFIWPAVVMKSEARPTVWAADGDFDVNGVDYEYIIPFEAEAGRRWGNFYAANFDNCRLEGGIRGIFRSNVDWSYYKGGIVTTFWRYQDPSQNTSGQIPAYFAAITGTAFDARGAYISANGGIGNVTSNPSKGIVFTSAKAHSFGSIYSEWVNTNFVVDKHTFTDGGDSRSMGLHIDSVSQYREDPKTMSMLAFQPGCFGYYDSNDEWHYPDGFGGNTFTPQGISEIVIGSPSRDVGAFHYGGFDFKYATNNIRRVSATADIDSIRNSKTAKEMFNPYGLILSSGSIALAVKSPSFRTAIHVWIKDLTGNFNPANIALFLNGAQENPANNSNDSLSYGELQVDFGNGYKLITLMNRKQYANDGVNNYTPQVSLFIQNTSGSTPIILKAVEAYSGGISVFPQGCDYVPSAYINSGNIYGPTSAYYGFENQGMGGGIFQNGDIISPWIGVASGSAYNTDKAVTNGKDTLTALVSGGFNLASDMKTTFTANVISTTSTTSTIRLSSSSVISVCQGIDLYIASGSSTSFTGQAKIRKRVFNSDGTVTYDYVLNSVVGSAGDVITINQSLLPAISLYRDISATSLTTTGDVTANYLSARRNLLVTGGFINLGRNYGSAHTDHLAFHPRGNYDLDGEISVYSDTGGNCTATYSFASNVFTGNVRPSSSASFSLGSTSLPWNNVYLQNAPVIVSDKRLKEDISEISDDVLDAWDSVDFVQFRMSDAVLSKGDGARMHFGVIAQDIKEKFEAKGLDATRYGILIHEEWGAQDEVIESWGDEYAKAESETDTDDSSLGEMILVRRAGSRVVSEKVEAGDRWLVRIEECLILEAMCQRRRGK